MTHAKPPRITFEPLHPSVKPPTRATAWSAGYDLKSYLFGRTVKVIEANNTSHDIYCPTDNPTLTLMPGDRAMVPLGFKARLPAEYEAQIRPRSGKAIKLGLTVINAPGTVDADYPNEWMILVLNVSAIPLVIDHEEAIAQMVLAKYEVLQFADGVVGVSTERAGGFGSTDAKGS